MHKSIVPSFFQSDVLVTLSFLFLCMISDLGVSRFDTIVLLNFDDDNEFVVNIGKVNGSNFWHID